VPELLSEAEALLSQIEAARAANPGKISAEMVKTLKGAIKVLEGMRDGRIEATVEGVKGERANIEGVAREFQLAQTEPGAVGTNRKFSLDGRPDAVEVDVVADNGRTWIDSKRVEPFGLESNNWTGKPGKQGLKVQAEEMVRSASQNPVDGVPPTVVIDFPLGVSPEVAAALRAMGIQVRGAIVKPPSAPPVPVPVTPPDEKDGGE
jgi:hypothetical protein